MTPEGIEKSSSSYVDPNGFVFFHQGNVYRAIYRTAESFYRQLFEDKTIEKLISRHHLVETTISGITFPDPEIGLVLQHERVEPATYCVEWCPSMLRDAGCALIDLALAILEKDCILQDCYPWNVLFRGTEPRIIDFTSIVKIDTAWIWPAYEQFQAFFLRPLILCEQGKGKIARALLYNNIDGLSLNDLAQNVTSLYKAGHPSVSLQNKLHAYMGRRPSFSIWLRKALEQGKKKKIDRKVRYRFLNNLLKKLRRFHFKKNIDHWSNYYSQMDQTPHENLKFAAISRILNRIHPDSVLDIGSNTGVFSVLAAKSGARVVSVDSSEACIESLYQKANQEKLNITPLVIDLLCPTPSFGFMGRQYPPLVERIKSEFVMCLGLLHHLHIAGRQSFQRISELMNSLSNRYLICEFVDQLDDNNLLLGAGRPIHYDLQDVVQSLSKYFPSIEILDSDRPTRKLLICSKY